MFSWIIIALAVILIDQLSKFFIVSNVQLYEHFTFIPGIIDIAYVKNTGAAFSILDKHTWLLAILSIIVSAFIVIYMVKTKPVDKLTVISAGLILGGALGNGIDRIVRQYVVDFIEFSFINFPVFNVADIAITVGACLIILSIIISEKELKKDKE